MKKPFKTRRFLLVLILLSFIPLVGAMGFFDSMKVYLFSDMKGVVLYEGKPVEGAKIIRTAMTNNDKEHKDSTTSDSTGHFQFDQMDTKLFLKLLPTTIRVNQKIIIEFKGQQYLAWKAFTGGENKGELNNTDVIGTSKEININLNCELTASESIKASESISTSGIKGICSWEGQKILD